MRYFVGIISGIVALSIVVGFLIVGSPAKERNRRFDQRRVNDLQNIQNQIISYWQVKGLLPPTLESLFSDIENFKTPQDPVSDTAYEYRAKPPLQFTLCANFAQQGDGNNEGAMPSTMPFPVGYKMGGKPVMSSWSHGAGRVCFDRTIDPDYYKPLKDQLLPLNPRPYPQ